MSRDLIEQESQSELERNRQQWQLQEVALTERLKQQADLQQRLAQRETEVAMLGRELAALKAHSVSERKGLENQIQMLRAAKTEMSREFESIASKVFEGKQQSFKEQSSSILAGSIDPLKAQLAEFRQRVDKVYDQENAERNRLAGKIGELQKQTLKIGDDAVQLANALRGDNKAQGNWGEMLLENILEESGLQRGRDYETQLALKDADGRKRSPDVVIHLPQKKDIVIDAKMSLLDYERYCSSSEADDRSRHLKAHVSSIRSHVKGLSIKGYENLEGVNSLDFVFIFIPVEAAFMLALQNSPEIFREAYDRQIILVSPTTLLATLRAVESVWRYEKQNKNSEKMAAQAGALYDQFVLLLEAFDDVGSSIGKSQLAYDTLRKRMNDGRGNLIKRAEQIKSLGAKTKRAIPDVWLDESDAVHGHL